MASYYIKLPIISGGSGFVTSVNGQTGVVVLTKSDLGLGNVDNTSDVNKPVSTAQAAADTAVQNFSIQRANHTGTQLSSSISDFNTQVATTALLKANNLSGLTNTATARTNIGLGNVDNTSDVNKPVSTAQAAADTAVQNFSIQRANHTGTQTLGTLSQSGASSTNVPQWNGSAWVPASGGGVGTETSTILVALNTKSTIQAGLRVKGFSGQTANLQEWQNSAGTNLATIDGAGKVGIGIAPSASLSLNIAGSISATTYGFNGQVGQNIGMFTSGTTLNVVSGGSNGNFNLGNASNGSAYLSVDGSTFNWGIGTTGPLSRLHVVTNSAAKSAIIAQGAAAQSVPIQEWRNSSAATLVSIGANGKLNLTAATTSIASINVPSGTAPSSPNNGDIWFDGTNIKIQVGGVTKTFTLI